MPVLRSTRFRKSKVENPEAKENVSEIDQQQGKQKANKNKNAGREFKKVRIVLKDIKGNKKSVKGKMKTDLINEKTEEIIKEDKPKSPASKEIAVENCDPENQQVEETDKRPEEPTPTLKNSENNDEVIPNKRPKLDHEELKSIEGEKETIKNETGEKLQGETGESDASLPQNTDKTELEEKPSSTTNTNANVSKTKSISLKSQINANKDAGDGDSPGSNLPIQLLTVISNLYLNVGERLKLDFPPRCLDDLAFCHRHHYRAELPEAPITSQAHSLRSALQHHRYLSFINTTTYMCHRGEFPGKGIFTKIMELVLVSLKPFNLKISLHYNFFSCSFLRALTTVLNKRMLT